MAEEHGKATQAAVRERNLTTALQLVLSGNGTATRAAIARRTGLTSATVSSLLAGLIADGLVIEGQLAESTGGKRATTLRVAAENHVLLALLVQPGLVRGAVVDLLGDELATVTQRAATPGSLEDVRSVARRLVASTSARIVAVGVQVPGIADGPLIRESVQLGWTDVDLARELSGIVDAPIHLINDADAEAIADSITSDDFGANQLFVSLSTGVGAAVIIDGEVVAGAAHRAGEIGHVPVLFGPDAPLCACGNRGCLEEIVSVTSLLGLPHGTDLEALDLAALAAAPDSRERIADGARVLARALLLVAAALDVPNIVIGGAAPRLGPEFIGHLRAEAARHPVKAAMPLSFRYARVGQEHPYRGAAQYALKSALGVTWAH
ncbi:Sugar kinase of the NBD/HSP70 family, may contain an N-terminal HTH domain [Leifsonia sp. 98AMF]|uniref:ROK family transcriptional regulator n=1 Tax=unclassified Leifsonia TaxID=2663824 RepID=UPI00087D62AA|nr:MULTISPECIES: ROK family transcriptional regulator [unclassified Leifsonia]SDH27430.1 Sugar kinase of the NBD/HSP70 family, may contain an N-terminal HTH domain [Leifsonia sp. 197AMF]SDJ11175.1 Sugar kinase of the NBD/HSP70 family, may contain an N-terminal HTH domain [Leifsonia sp. 466MF]SDJ58939.1 Sugar kinase of the NBD/HSP70 family, may contain an N-terminal HTH domain [Leifsonia sp. 157MF]SDN32460.1 Sugar kinase of the NBD/HSP70 family, may contain an N-terminal HTH domain [Leifsonia sp